MSLPYTVAPGTGATDVSSGRRTETGGAEGAKAERIKPRVAAIVLSRPGRVVDASSTRGTRPVCFMTVTTPKVQGGVAPNFSKAPETELCSRP